ncbi:MAG: PilZ domain-containing protein [Candidatus Omnitrophica bacterium]|nr:PilZ domain-containing protein [Candidatus Omnitrophota bacterium]
MDQVPPSSEQNQPAAERPSRRIENRLFERFSARFPVKFRHTRSDYGSDVFLRDASARGVKISTREKVFLNDSVSLEVKIPDGSEPVTLNGRVVWLHSKSPSLWEAGVELHEINLMEMQRIFKYVSP